MAFVPKPRVYLKRRKSSEINTDFLKPLSAKIDEDSDSNSNESSVKLKANTRNSFPISKKESSIPYGRVLIGTTTSAAGTTNTSSIATKTKAKRKKDTFLPSPSPTKKKRKYKRQTKSKFDDIEDDDNNTKYNNNRELAKDYYIDADGNKVDYTAPQGMFFIPF